MAAIVPIISAISGICSIVKFGQSEFAMSQEADTNLKVSIGLDYSGGLSNAGGDMPDIRLFNEAGDFVGMDADPGGVDDGAVGEASVESDGQQATYVLLSANDDAICFAYMSVTWPDQNKYAWEGSWAKQCGAAWYYSHTYIEESSYKPPCMWIDANGDEPQTGVSMHIPEFVSKSARPPKNKDVDYFCNNTPVFQLHTEPDPSVIQYWTLGHNGNNTKVKRSNPEAVTPKRHPGRHALFTRPAHSNTTRPGLDDLEDGDEKTQKAIALARKQDKHRNKLVISDDAENHSTQELCDSETSRGPDFLNIEESKFCDMSEHKLYDVCHGKKTDNCYNKEIHSLVIGGKAARTTGYEWIQDWSLPGNSQ